MKKLVSIDLKSDFGFFRKPDANNTINLSYNMLHKPALLGIFGAIIGLNGYKEKGKLPNYYEIFHDIKVGVEPLEHEKGNFSKTAIKYSNTVGYANNGSTYLTEEATLIKPSYRVYVLLDFENEYHESLYHNLKEGSSEYIPYFGKNEFTAWWEKESFEEYLFEKVEHPLTDFNIKTLFLKEDVIKTHKTEPFFNIMSFGEIETPFMYFERLPKGFDLSLFQYDLGDFIFSTFSLKPTAKIENLFHLTSLDYYVQLL